MNGWLRKVRGILGLGAVGGVFGSLGGAIWAAVSSLLSWGAVFGGTIVASAVIWGVVGSVSGLGFAALLATLDGRKSIGELTIGRCGLFGLAVGGLIPVALVLGQTGSLLSVPLVVLLRAMALSGGVGALVSSSMIALAKHAHRRELAGIDDASHLLSRD